MGRRDGLKFSFLCESVFSSRYLQFQHQIEQHTRSCSRLQSFPISFSQPSAATLHFTPQKIPNHPPEMLSTTTLSLILTILPLTLARTDLSGCTSTTAGASIIYYVPGTGELCSFLDCGGGRAPPKTTVPGCPQYAGTATYSPSFLAGFGAGAAASTSVVAATTSPSPAITSTGGEASVITLSGTVSPSSTASVVSSGSQSSIGVSTGADGSTIVVTSSTPTGSAASQSVSSASSSGSSSGTGSGTGTSTGTAAGATNTNAGAANAVNGVVGAVAAGIAFLL